MRSVASIWRSLPLASKREAIDAYLRFAATFDAAHDSVLRYIATSSRTPISILRSLSREQQADRMARSAAFDPIFHREFLVQLHLQRRVPMLCAFLDAAGISHQGGAVSREAAAVKSSAAALERGVLAITSAFAAGEVEVYLDLLEVLDQPVWAGLPEARRKVPGGERLAPVR